MPNRTSKPRKCLRCGYSLFEYALGEKLCGACANEKEQLKAWKRAVADGETLVGFQEWADSSAAALHGGFEEPEACIECESKSTMEFDHCTVNNKLTTVPAWICQDCGHAHLKPDHIEDECVGC